MTLPDYFLADVDAEPTPALVQEAARTVRRNRARFLAERSTEDVIETLAEVASNWMDPEDPFRVMALEQGPELSGFSREVLQRGVDTFFGRIHRDSLEALLLQELGHGRRLDQFATVEAEFGSRALARGPELIAHFTAGNVPVPAWFSMLAGLLVRSAQVIKCACGADFFPRLFGHSIYAVDSKLGACLEIATWSGGHRDIEEHLFAEVDLVTATGRNETLSQIRGRLPEGVRFVGHGHKVSFLLATREVLSRAGLRQWLPRIVDDIVAWDQHGCLSPHIIYAEVGGAVPAEELSASLASALEEREELEPRGRLTEEEHATIRMKRDFYEIRAAHSTETCIWSSKKGTAWTVVFEQDPLFQLSCLNRFIYVKPVAQLEELLRVAEPVRHQVSTVGVACPASKLESIAHELAHWGASRVCPAGQMQDPPLAWHHDGRPPLADLVLWTDLERIRD